MSSKKNLKPPRYPREVKLVLERIRILREEKGLSLIALAAESEVSKAFLFDVEKGLKMPSLMTLYKITKGLGVPLKALFEDVQK